MIGRKQMTGKKELSEAYDIGFDAGAYMGPGKKYTRRDNPYPSRLPEHSWWIMGFDAGRKLISNDKER